MAVKIMMKKLNSLSSFQELNYCIKADCIETKNRAVTSKLKEKSHYNLMRCPKTALEKNNFREKWRCMKCYYVSRLKPLRRYKSLLTFSLVCSRCGASCIYHSKVAGTWNNCIEFEVKNKTKYIPAFVGKDLDYDEEFMCSKAERIALLDFKDDGSSYVSK